MSGIALSFEFHLGKFSKKVVLSLKLLSLHSLSGDHRSEHHRAYLYVVKKQDAFNTSSFIPDRLCVLHPVIDTERVMFVFFLNHSSLPKAY